MESPHEVLAVDPDADEEEIKRAYRRRVKETHPDHGGSTRAFRRVRAAYEELKAGDRRAVDVDEADPVAAGEAVDGPDAAAAPDEPPLETEVEYLDYEVLDDRGWALDDGDLFEKAAAADLEPGDYGRFLVEPGETLLEAAERSGFTWPYSCRGGACANCAVSVSDGDLEMPLNHVLTEDLTDRGICLSCIGTPVGETLQVVYNVKHLPDVEDLLLPPGPFNAAKLND